MMQRELFLWSVLCARRSLALYHRKLAVATRDGLIKTPREKENGAWPLVEKRGMDRRTGERFCLVVSRKHGSLTTCSWGE